MNSDAVADRPSDPQDPRGDAAGTGRPSGRVVLVSGPSGAGRSTALAALEDMGCETIDNIPLSLVPRLMEGPALAAPLVLGLDAPDAIFIGGGLSEAVFDAAWAALRPLGRLVANAVTLESEAVLIGLHARHGGALVRIQIARAEPVGRLTGWRPLMPVTQWSLVKR